MLILLPPSERKAAPGSGGPLDLATLSLPELNPARERAVESLVSLCAQPDDERAGAILGLSPGQRGEVLHNTRLRQAPAMAAGQLYTGVLYEALDLVSLSATAYELAERSVLVFSGLWGAVRIGDRIPAYRDLRSAAYSAMWTPKGELAGRTALVRVLHERIVGGVTTRSVVSHFNKARKGRLVRRVLTAGTRPGPPAPVPKA